MVHGDLVLLDSEINPVISALQDHDFAITAVHNHLLNETPSIMYVHYWGEGGAALAQALQRRARPIEDADRRRSRAAPASRQPPTHGLPAEQIQQAIGLTRHGRRTACSASRSRGPR